MAFTTDDLAAIDAVIASGELTVRYADRTIQYQSTDALLKARKLMVDEMAGASSTPRKRITRISRLGNGYGR